MKSRLRAIIRSRAWKAATGVTLVFGLLLYAQSWLVPIEGLHVPSPRNLCAAELPAPVAQSSCPVGSLEHFANSWTQSFGTAFTQSQSATLTANRVVTWPDASGTVAYLELAQLWPASQTFTALTATTADINGGTVDSVTVGGVTPGAGTFTSLNATGGGALTGTWSNLGSVTTIDINGGTFDGVTIGGSTPGAGTFTTITATGDTDLQNNDLNNVGNAGTDFTASGNNIAGDTTFSDQIFADDPEYLDALYSSSGPWARQIIGKKTGITDAVATDVLTFTVPNEYTGATYTIKYITTTNNPKDWRMGEIAVDVNRTPTAAAEAQLTALVTERWNQTGGGTTHTTAFGLVLNGEGASSTETIDLTVTIDTSDSTTGAIVFTIEALEGIHPNSPSASERTTVTLQ